MAFAAGQVITNKGAAAFGSANFTTLKYIAGGVGATSMARTAAVGDTALSSELAEGRATGTVTNVTTTVTNDTFQVVGTITATGSRAVDEMGVFDASTSGNMGISVTHAAQNLASGDSIQYTVKIKFVPG